MAKVSISEIFPSKWLSANDLGDDDLVVTIAEEPLDYQEFKQPGKDTPDRKPVLYFSAPRKTKPLVLNKVNFTTLLALLGEETDEWQGRQIALGVEEVEAFGKRTLAIRIRTKLPQTKTKAKSAPTPAPVEATASDVGF